MLFTGEYILLRDTWHLGRQMSYLSVQKTLTVSSNLHYTYYVQKQVQLLSFLSMNKCAVFL
jgi:hypothetical protein